MAPGRAKGKHNCSLPSWAIPVSQIFLVHLPEGVSDANEGVSYGTMLATLKVCSRFVFLALSTIINRMKIW